MPFAALSRRIQRLFAGGRTVVDLAEWLSVDARGLRNTPVEYRRFSIAKRSGGGREIAAPSEGLKRLQRRILRRLLNGLPTHPAATGFQRGRSIVENAVPHVGQAVVVNVDLEEFFPSTGGDRVYRLFRRCGWGRGAARLLARLCTHEGGLPQGAPTSPRLSNLLNRLLDEDLSRLAADRDGRYTRYADDITFSFTHDDGDAVRQLLRQARGIAKRHGYRMHRRRKVSIRRRHQRQLVTGLVVNERPRLPRETRRRLRAARHRIATGREGPTTRATVDGWLSFQRMVDTRVEQAGAASRSTGDTP